jgi:hypothetical protein
LMVQMLMVQMLMDQLLHPCAHACASASFAAGFADRLHPNERKRHLELACRCWASMRNHLQRVCLP